MRTILLILFTLTSFQAAYTQIQSRSDFTIGETIQYTSEVLGEDRILNIYLPHGYHPDSLKKYPVIYLLDGSVDEDFIHVAGAVQFCSFSWIDIIPESIVVGIANVDRKRDFTTPSSDEKDNEYLPTSGGSARFIEFISKELIPLINTSYKTTDVSTLIGQSLGGLLATHILYEHTVLFDNYIIISPSLWWDTEKLLKSSARPAIQNHKVYVGVGKEGRGMERLAHSLYFQLINANPDSEIHFKFFEDKDHGDVLHHAVYDAFEKLFEKPDKKSE